MVIGVAPKDARMTLAPLPPQRCKKPSAKVGNTPSPRAVQAAKATPTIPVLVESGSNVDWGYRFVFDLPKCTTTPRSSPG